MGVGVTIFATEPTTTASTTNTPSLAPITPAPAMRDMAVGTDDESFDPDAALSEEKLEKILKESGLEMGKERMRKKEKHKGNDLHVDRI